MSDRLLLWLAGLAPLLTMLLVLTLPRWPKLNAARRTREMLYTGLFLALIGAVMAWDMLGQNRATMLNVRIQRPWLLLFLPPLLGLFLFIQHRTLAGISRGRMWTAYLLRGMMSVLLLLALAGLQMVLEQDLLSVIYALDVSKSVPTSQREEALKYIRESVKKKPADAKAGLLVFGGSAEWEVAPSTLFSAPEQKNFKAVAQPNATNVAGALKRALSRSEDEGRKRIVLFTDGRQTSGDAAEHLKDAVSLGADVWIVPLQRGTNAEMLVEKVVLPNMLLWEQPFDAHVFVFSNINTTARVSLYTGDRLGGNPPSQTVQLTAGKNRVTFPALRMRSGGAKEIRAVIEPLNREDDTLLENNEAYAFTEVQTDSRVLILTSDVAEVKHLLAALEGEKMTVDVRAGASLPEGTEAYRAYDCIVLANIARGMFSEEQMRSIETCVKDQGAGLVMIGGDQSFGAGGWLGTPIEDALPVQMDLRNQRVMPSGALCIVLHTCEFSDGNAWGKKLSKAAINVLSPQDYAGLIYYGNMGGEQWAFKPAKVRKEVMFGLIDGCDPGDMPTLDPIVSMAATSLKNLQNVSVKHCIVITDGDPGPPTAATMAIAKNNAITISIITIFPHGGADISVMKDIAAQTGGRYYSADDPKKLPQIFIKEAAVVRKSLIRSDEKGIPLSLAVPGPTLKEFGAKFPDVTAFVVTAPKDRAELQLFTVVEGEKIPLMMSWHYGLGKTVAFTSDCTNRWASKWVEWPSYKKFWINTLSWASRQRMPPNHTVTTRIEGNQARVIVEAMDAKGEYLNFARLSGNAIDPDVTRNGTDGRTYDLNFEMKGPGRYEAVFPIDKAGAYSVTVVDASDVKKPMAMVTGIANSYSPEFLHLDNDDILLAKLGEIATGKSDVSRLKDMTKLDRTGADLFKHDLPPISQPTELFWWLLIAALCIFPIDVAIRRLALDPETFFTAAWARLQPLIGRLRSKQAQMADAAAEALKGAQAAPVPPPDIVPTGSQSRDAQGRYEQAGQSADFNLNPNAEGQETKPTVGGTRVSTADEAASDYTNALLKAKKRANKDKK